MSALANQAHERFCQGRALGLSWRAAFRFAGYREGGGYATRLAKKPEVLARLLELAEERRALEETSPARLILLLSEAIEAIKDDKTARGVSAVRNCIALIEKLSQHLREEKGRAEAFNHHVRGEIWRETGEKTYPTRIDAPCAAEIADEDLEIDALPPRVPAMPAASPDAP